MALADDWYLDHDNIMILAHYMVERNDDAQTIVHMIEKPWKYETEFKTAKFLQKAEGTDNFTDIVVWLEHNTDADDDEIVDAVIKALTAKPDLLKIDPDAAAEQIWSNKSYWNF